MGTKIGSFLTKYGTEGNDYSFDIKSGDWHLGYGGDDQLNPSTTGYLLLDSKPYIIPAIISGGYGNDTYKLNPISNVVLADNSTSDKDVLTFSDVYANEITVLFTIDGRHLFMQAAQNRNVNYIFPASILILDALNSQGAIEIIEFKHINHSSFNSLVDSQSIGSLLSTYKTKKDQSLSEFLASGYLNPKVIGLELSEVADMITTLTVPANQALATYTLTPSATTINEGSTLATSVATTDVASGTTLYYSLSGTGITTSDFSSGALTGSGSVASNGSFTFSHTLANDLTTEGTETLNIKLYTDAARTVQVGATATVNIVDSSTTPEPTYTLTPSSTSINEGAVLTNTVVLSNSPKADQLSGGVERSYLRDLSGIATQSGDTISVRYTGKLNNGSIFDSNSNGAKPEFSFQLGAGKVIKGWDTGLLGVNVGDVIQLYIPANQAYGNIAIGAIPANSPLNFEIEVLGRSNTFGSERFSTSPKLYYALSGTGITASDFSAGTLTGEGSIDTAGKFIFSHTLANDLVTEGTETLNIKLFSDSNRLTKVGEANISIIDYVGGSTDYSYSLSRLSGSTSPNSLVFAFENYQFYNLGGNRQGIQKKGTGAIDEITGISTLTFNDSRISVSDNIIGVFTQVTGKETKDAQMFRLYNASFNRFPDSDGLKYWINEYSKGITDYRKIAESFIISNEFKQRYGATNTNLEFATNMYKNILGRLPDSEGLNYWVSNLNAGTNSRVDVLGGFSESIENKNLFSQVTGFI